MADSDFGVSASGFIPKQQSQIADEITVALQGVFGKSINLRPESIFGQLYNIFAEREALLWQEAEAVYASQFPAGATGVSVDNILALNNLTRLSATPTVTNPTPATQTNGLTLYGLVFYGVAGTVIPAGSLVQTSGSPSTVFTVDKAVTIGPASNASQTVVFSAAPSSSATGSYTLAFQDRLSNTLRTAPIAALARPTATLITWPTWPTIPSSGTYQIMVDGNLTAPIAANNNNAIFSAILALPNSTINSTLAGASGVLVQWSGYNPGVETNPTTVTLSGANGTGFYNLIVGGVSTANIPAAATIAQVQAAIQATGYPTAKVAAAATNQMAISFAPLASPGVVMGTNGTSVTVTVGQLNSQAPTVVQSVQSAINALVDSALPAGAQRPYTDAGVTAQGSNLVIGFGQNPVQLTGQPASGYQPQPLIAVPTNTVQNSGVPINITVTMSNAGSVAQAVGTATCRDTGANEAAAGAISVIGSPISGWTGVTNQLDALPGTDAESDSQALARRYTLLSANARSPLQAIIDKVATIHGVTSVVGFENPSQAALQTLTFGATPVGGTFQLVLGSGTTTPLPYNASATDIQGALNTIPAYASAKVSGSIGFGFSVDFSGSIGAQSQPLINVANNTTGVSITSSYGRSPNSFEIVVTGGDATEIAQAIYNNKPAGISAYASPSSITTGTVTIGSAQITVASSANIGSGLAIFGLGVPNGTTVSSVAGNTVTMSNAAIGSYTNTPITFTNAVQVLDAYNNPQIIGFSRPSSVLFYVNVSLVTDQYRTPGVAASGANGMAKFTPGSVQTVREKIIAAGNAVPVGGLVVGTGTDGLVGSFNDVPGIVSYALTFGTSPSPTNTGNIQLLPTQQANFQLANVTISYV